MKYLLHIVLFCCSLGYGQKYNPLDDYIANNTEKKIYILKEKLPVKRTLTIFKGSEVYDAINGYTVEGYRSKLYNEDEFNELQSLYAYDTVNKYWQTKEFKGRVKLINDKEFNIIKAKNLEDNVYALSDVIFYQNKKYALFSVIRFSLNHIPVVKEDCLVIMTKENEDWVIVEKIPANSFALTD